MSINAFIFDLDGVLTDTAEYHYLAWAELANELGIAFSREDNEHLKGVDRMASLAFILDKGGITLDEDKKLQLADKKNQHYQQLINRMSPEDLFEGVLPLFDQLKQQGIRIGLASASKNAALVLTRLGITDAFDYIADAAKIAQGKPHPEIFLTVAKALDIPVHSCVGVEDSIAGLHSILDAGMHSIGIGDAEVLAAADLVYPTIGQLDLAEITTEF
ncbi:beta-phosphoglucomutase [Neptunicella sp. SCSIO 80796]|uniref:beta-phosphoglucomutase n=1 Tax=Neptunicella plasticusilytica TaxID=3117012 RepID=UPI003A4D22C4